MPIVCRPMNKIRQILILEFFDLNRGIIHKLLD